MFNHHTQGKYPNEHFPPPSQPGRSSGEAFNEIFSYNEDDPDASRFSILGQIEKYRKNGAFHIRLCYPDYTEDFPCNEWTQTSNFMQDKVITDYNPIRITYLQRDSENDFDGLKRSSSWFTWVSSSYAWRFMVGYCQADLQYGAYSKPRVSHVELYLLAGMIKIF